MAYGTRGGESYSQMGIFESLGTVAMGIGFVEFLVGKISRIGKRDERKRSILLLG